MSGSGSVSLTATSGSPSDEMPASEIDVVGFLFAEFDTATSFDTPADLEVTGSCGFGSGVAVVSGGTWALSFLRYRSKRGFRSA